MTQHRFKVGDVVRSRPEVSDSGLCYTIVECLVVRGKQMLRFGGVYRDTGTYDAEAFIFPWELIPPDPLVTDLVSDYLAAQEGG